jgi:hypothetical protein
MQHGTDARLPLGFFPENRRCAKSFHNGAISGNAKRDKDITTAIAHIFRCENIFVPKQRNSYWRTSLLEADFLCLSEKVEICHGERAAISNRRFRLRIPWGNRYRRHLTKPIRDNK